MDANSPKIWTFWRDGESNKRMIECQGNVARTFAGYLRLVRTTARSARSHSSYNSASCRCVTSYWSLTLTNLVMSRAISGFDISSESSANRFSNSAISASTISGSRAFLTTLIRFDSSPDEADTACFARADRGTAGFRLCEDTFPGDRSSDSPAGALAGNAAAPPRADFQL